MLTGIILPALTSIATSTSEAILIGAETRTRKIAAAAISKATLSPTTPLKQSLNAATAPINWQWVPPQWSQPALTILRVSYPPYTVSATQASPVQIDHVFDAVFKLSHRRVLRKTSHPVLTGANISDHAYVEPARITLEIGMSDAMASYTDSMWTGQATKSVSAWAKIKELQVHKMVFQLITRLDTYDRVMIVEAEAPDDNSSRHGLRASIIFEELLSGSIVSIPAVSARDQTTGSTQGGTIQSSSTNPADAAHHDIPEYLKLNGYPNRDLPQLPIKFPPDLPQLPIDFPPELPQLDLDTLRKYADKLPINFYPQVPGAGVISGNRLEEILKPVPMPTP